MARKAERTWIVVADATDPDLDIAEVRTFITTSGDISNWWNYIPGTYIVKSNLGPDELSDRLKPLTRDARFLVMQVEPTDPKGGFRSERGVGYAGARGSARTWLR